MAKKRKTGPLKGSGGKGGKGRKAATAAESASREASGDLPRARVQCSQDVLDKALALRKRVRGQTRTLSGQLGNFIRDAQEDGLNPDAWRTIAKVLDKDPEKMRVWWDDFHYYAQAYGIEDKMAPALFDRAETPPQTRSDPPPARRRGPRAGAPPATNGAAAGAVSLEEARARKAAGIPGPDDDKGEDEGADAA